MSSSEIQVSFLHLQKHYRYRWVAFITAIIPACLMIGYSLAVEHWFPLVMMVMFLVVGALNWYLMASRPVPQEVILRSDSLSIVLGSERFDYSLSQIMEAKESPINLRGRQHIGLRFTDGQSFRLYAHAYNIVSLNHAPVKKGFFDIFHPSWKIWDRPIELTRQFLKKHGKLS